MARSRTSRSARRTSEGAGRDRDAARTAGRRLLAFSALGAANTANARTPFARRGPVSVPSFFSGWLTSELPLHTIGVQALATVGWARKGALRTPAGLAALGVNAASWVALSRIWKEAMAQDQIFDAALREALGDDLDVGTSPLDAEPGAAVVDRRRIAAGPLTPWKKRYVAGPALSYGDAGRRNELDIWRRPDLPKDGKAPVLLNVHGGAWIIGNKDQQAMPLMSHLADRGWVCVSINYRLSPRATWPDHIVDVKRALAWIKDHIAEYGGDPEFVAISGGSAGGHLSSLAALTANEPEFQPGFEDKDTSVVAAVPFYGVYDFTNRDGTGRMDMTELLSDMVFKTKPADAAEVWDHASSMSWVDHEAPPFMVVHGANDALVPVEQARSFVSMLREESPNPVAYVELPGAQHAFEVFDSPRTIYSARAVHRFLEAIRARAGHVADVEAGAEREAEVAATTDAPIDTPAPSAPTSSSTAPSPAPVPSRAKAAPTATARSIVEDTAEVPVVADPATRIKGTKSKKYHVPGSQWYDRTTASVWFDSVEEAVAAGFAPAGGAARQNLAD
jgi:acetyl esterase/lipase